VGDLEIVLDQAIRAFIVLLLMRVEGAIHSGERIASPCYRRERERNRDGSFAANYDQACYDFPAR